MVIKQKNLFISSACSYPKDFTIFSGSERLQHLRETINSCKRIDDSINVISEGSHISDEEKSMFNDSIVFTYKNDKTIEWATQTKQLGTPMLWLAALQNIEVANDTNIFFLSGRYQLLPEFKTKDFTGDYSFKKHWYVEGRGGWYGTQLYKISGRVKIEYEYVLQECINRLLDGTAQDIECAIYQSLTTRGIIPTELESVHCVGLLGPNGKKEKH